MPAQTPRTRERLFAPLPESVSDDPDAAEREVLERWRAERAFEAVRAAHATDPPFVFWEGPPTANGRPGIHHVFARTIKDTVCRYRTMLGRRVERKAGWDTHGLPVELEVERELGIDGKQAIEEFGVAEFNRRCRESVWKYKREWEELSERMAYWLDYEHPYITYDPDYVESVWAILKRFHDAGLVYKGLRVVPFCGRCGTGLSSHELGQPGVYQEIRDPSVTVRFRLVESSGSEPESLLAWTTTPWTLPSNVALAVHPDVEYVQARVAVPVPKGEQPGSLGFELVWLAQARVASVLGDGVEILRACAGRELVGIRYQPLFDAEVPEVDPGTWSPDPNKRWSVVAATYVSVEEGTGIVHQAPSYGADDWATAREARLPVLQAVGAAGRFVVPIGPVPAGTAFKEADRLLCEDLDSRGLLFAASREVHSYPHCWRCKTPLFYFATPAWFIRTTAYKERMIEANRQTRWVPPEVGEKRLGDWLENNVDWNVSRDRYWGTPLPFWECEGCDAQRAIGSVEELRELAGALPEDFDNHKPAIDQITFPCEACGGTMRRTPSVADCWLDSGSMPFAQYHWPFGDGRHKVAEQYPADFIAEGLDQTRGWFYTLLAVGSFLASLGEQEIPEGPVYRTCVVNGLVLDKDGVKMSKSLGNVVDPWEAIRVGGIDAVRWYMLSSGAPWLPKRFDVSGVQEVRRRFLATLAHSYRFLAEYARIDGFDPCAEGLPAVSERPEIDRWLLSRTQSLARVVRERMDVYDLAGACREIEHFVVDELSNWYIRRNRRRFWKSERGRDKLAAFATLTDALRATTLLLAPFTPFLAELLWERLGGTGETVHVERYPLPDLDSIDEGLEDAMNTVQSVVRMGRALRERAGIRVRQPLRALHVRASDPRVLELLSIEFAAREVLDELNVKQFGSLEADDGRLCTLVAKPAWRVLGKRLGARMKAAAAAIQGLPSSAVSRLRAGESIVLPLDGDPVTIGPEDVEIEMRSQTQFDVETDGTVIVFLDTELDDELVAEGWAREAVTRVNAVRKQRGLAVDARIRLFLCAQRSELRRALERHRDLIAEETLAVDLRVLDDPDGVEVHRTEIAGAGELLVALEAV